jgi:hypothetical protein
MANQPPGARLVTRLRTRIERAPLPHQIPFDRYTIGRFFGYGQSYFAVTLATLPDGSRQACPGEPSISTLRSPEAFWAAVHPITRMCLRARGYDADSALDHVIELEKMGDPYSTDYTSMLCQFPRVSS